MLNYINEAFKQLNLITESVFDTSEDGLTELSTFITNDDEVEQITVINDELDTEDNIPDPKVGDLILNCNICHSLMFKNKDDITINEKGEVNKDYPCPRCGETDGYTIVGEIQEFKPESEEEIEPVVDETPAEEPTEEPTEEPNEEITESLNEATGKTPWDIIVATYPELNTISENLTEGFNNVSIETETDRMTMTSDDNGKVTVTTEPIANDTIAEEGTVIAPVSDETQDAIISANAEVETEETPDEDEMMDFDFDEVDETSFDELGESYLKRVYENVDSFKTTKVSTTDNQLIVEGLISFKSGVKKNTGFIFEAKDATKEGRLRFVGENKHFSRGNKAFTLVGSMNESKKLICESFTYNYRAKTPAGKATRVYGTVSYKK